MLGKETITAMIKVFFMSIKKHDITMAVTVQSSRKFTVTQMTLFPKSEIPKSSREKKFPVDPIAQALRQNQTW
jgi:hypothetical protein